MLFFINITFYYLFGVYCFVVFAIIVAGSYSCSEIMGKCKSSYVKDFVLFSSIGTLVTILIFMKYQDFIYIENALFFPIGISFYVFKSISFLIEKHRGGLIYDNRFISCVSYISFFPAVQAGPIDRPKFLISQLDIGKKFQNDNIIIGAKLIIFGLFKKSVIADRLAPFVDNVYNNPHGFKSGALLLAVFMYSFQIYFDF